MKFRLRKKILAFLLIGPILSPALFAAEVVTPSEGSKSESKTQDSHLTSPTPSPQVKPPSTAKTPPVVFRGKASFNMIGGNQKNKDTVTIFGQPNAAINGGSAVSKTRNGSYMFSLDDTQLEAVVSNPMDFLSFQKWRFNLVFSADKSLAQTKRVIKEAYLTFLSPYSTVYVGNYKGVEDLMAYSGSSVLGGSGGFKGAYQNFFSPTTGVYTAVDLLGYTDRATKLSLMSSRINGFQLGFSFTPNSTQFGSSKLSTGTPPPSNGFVPYTVGNFAAGLQWMRALTPEIELRFSATALSAQAKPEKVLNSTNLERNRVRSWALGGILSYGDFSLATSYGRSGKSLQFARDQAGITPPQIAGQGVMGPLNYNSSQATGPQWFDIGVRYILQKTRFALGYYQSRRKTGFDAKARASIWNASITQQIQPGLEVYVEGYRVKTTNPRAAYEGKMVARNLQNGSIPVTLDNRANILITGVKASF